MWGCWELKRKFRLNAHRDDRHVNHTLANLTFSGSALLAYKINWQSVLFLGYGDDRELSAERRLEHVDRQVFVKLSHAFQR